MDHIKCDAPTKKAAEMITEVLKDAASEVGLTLNVRKCGIYSRIAEMNPEHQEEEIEFLPTIRGSYGPVYSILTRERHRNQHRSRERTCKGTD